MERTLACGNITFWLSELDEALKQEPHKHTPEVFAEYVQHLIVEEDKYCKMGTILDLSAEMDSYNSEIKDYGVRSSVVPPASKLMGL